MNTTQRRLRRYLRQHRLKLVFNRRHARVEDEEGHYLVTVASSPSCPYWAENVVSQLIKLGKLPPDAPRRWRS